MLDASSGSACCAPSANSNHTATINGVRLDAVSRAELAERIGSFLDCGQSHIVQFLAVHPTVLAKGDLDYRAVLNGGDVNLPDGVPVVWALRLFGQQAERVSGVDSFLSLCNWGVERNIRHYFYGGTPEVIDRLRASLSTQNPGIQIAGHEAPPFRPLSDEELAAASDRVRASRADFLWIGLGTPNQHFVAERFRELDTAPVILCVGAAFDFVSGVKRRAPVWMQRAGLEWVHRLASEPRRLWRRYLFGNPRFVVGVASDCLTKARRDIARGGGSAPRS